jgi:hypothetical protein
MLNQTPSHEAVQRNYGGGRSGTRSCLLPILLFPLQILIPPTAPRSVFLPVSMLPALCSINLGTRRRWVFSLTPQQGKVQTVTVGQKAGWAQEPVWTLCPSGKWSPNHGPPNLKPNYDTNRVIRVPCTQRKHRCHWVGITIAEVINVEVLIIMGCKLR